MADFSVSSINLAAVKQYDGYAKEILDRASQVALYTFNGDKNEWKKTEVEGALFVYSRSAEPHHNIIIMNRLNTFNLVEPVVPGLDIQEHAPFLLYRNNQLDIFGIWFYDKNECERIARVLDSLVKDWDKSKNEKQQMKRDTEKHPPPKVINVCANNNNNGVDICSMLSRAQEEYNSGKVPVSPLMLNDGVPTATPQSVMDFFAKASSSSNLNKEKAPPVQPPGLFAGKPRVPAPEHSEANLKPLMQRLMSNPVHSVEHIEKQQRSVTPQQNDLTATPDKAANKDPKQRNAGIPILDHRQEAPQKPELMPPVMFTSSLSNLPTTPKSLSKGVPVGVMQSCRPSLSKGVSEVMQSARDFSNIPALGKAEAVMQSCRPSLSKGVSEVMQSARDFSSIPALGKVEGVMQSCRPSLSKGVSEVMQSARDFSNIPPLGKVEGVMQLRESLPNIPARPVQSPISKPEPLTKNQLLQAFSYLLKNDPDFVNTLHAAYVKSFAEIVP